MAVHARRPAIDEEMQLAAAHAIAAVAKTDGLDAGYIVATVSSRDVVPAVAAAGERSGLARRQRAPKFGGVTGRTG